MVIEFFLPMQKIPTTTHQQKKVNARFGKPIFYEPEDLKNARAKFESLLAQYVPPDKFKGAPKWPARLLRSSGQTQSGSISRLRNCHEN